MKSQYYVLLIETFLLPLLCSSGRFGMVPAARTAQSPLPRTHRERILSEEAWKTDDPPNTQSPGISQSPGICLAFKDHYVKEWLDLVL